MFFSLINTSYSLPLITDIVENISMKKVFYNKQILRDLN